MTIATRVRLSLAALTLLLGGLLLYQSWVMLRLESISRRLASGSLRALRTVESLEQEVGLVHEFTSKFLATGDDGFKHALGELEESFAVRLAELRSLSHPLAAGQLEELDRAWKSGELAALGHFIAQLKESILRSVEVDAQRAAALSSRAELKG